jgi:hypothetical protein
LQNLTMLVGVLAAACLILRRLHLLLLLGALVLVVGYMALDLRYYTSRLLLSGDSTNLSALVFLQGWQRAGLNISETSGLGIGFQQFGYVGSLGDLAQRIVLLIGSNLNLYDGGSTGSKLVAEMGALGVALIALYLRLVVRGVVLIRRSQKLPLGQRDLRGIFFYSLIIAYASELFIRGNGYFTPSGFLVLAALLAVPRLGEATGRAIDPGQRPQMVPG